MATTYAQAKGQALRQAKGSRPSAIRGVPMSDDTLRDWIPIQPCICVTEPCPCDVLDDIVVWMPAAARSQKTKARVGSDQVVSYPVKSDEQVLVEVQIPMTTSQLRRLKEWSQRPGEPGAGSGQTGTAQKPVSAKDAVVAAFAVGYAIGEVLDEETGLSDSISDWAAENIPWPF